MCKCVCVCEVEKIYPSALKVKYSLEEQRKAWGKIVSVGGLSKGVFHKFYYSSEILNNTSRLAELAASHGRVIKSHLADLKLNTVKDTQ